MSNEPSIVPTTPSPTIDVSPAIVTTKSPSIQPSKAPIGSDGTDNGQGAGENTQESGSFITAEILVSFIVITIVCIVIACIMMCIIGMKKRKESKVKKEILSSHGTNVQMHHKVASGTMTDTHTHDHDGNKPTGMFTHKYTHIIICTKYNTYFMIHFGSCSVND